VPSHLRESARANSQRPGIRRRERDLPKVDPGDSIELVWREGIRLVSAQLENADSLDRKVAPLIALVTAIIAIAIA